ncbi:Gibberellin regulated protein [Macleaya cordata]|uniref:Gibberellin regulated protein n=1 Tax=Macleaya cordata TaxID=56857 RepID=A0A200QLE0_MACCD|nr:Gibberellin regulated protein [Macleaya cordata]
MASRMLLLVGILVIFCVAEQVSTIMDGEIEKINQQGVVRGVNRKLMEEIDCDGLCGVRCSLHSRPNVCMRACGTCCVRCKCVPPGTSGNREVCGTCYTDMTTHGNKTKCP